MNDAVISALEIRGQRWQSVGERLEEAVVEASHYRLSNTPATYPRSAPVYGRDNTFILENLLRYDVDQIAELQRAGALI